MGLQATWTPQRTLFLWAPSDKLSVSLARDLPGLVDPPAVSKRTLALAQDGAVSRKVVHGIELPLRQVVPALTAVATNAAVSDSIRCWALAAKFGLELATRKRVIPSIEGGYATWRALLTRKRDQVRFEALVASLPTVSRCLPTRERGRGAIELVQSRRVVQEFLDSLLDDLFRRNAHPGPARGWPWSWPKPSAASWPSSIRATPAITRSRCCSRPGSARSTSSSFGWGSGCRCPTTGQTGSSSPSESTRPPIPTPGSPVEDVWGAGESIRIGDRDFDHPAHAAIRGLARASRLHGGLRHCLEGDRPRNLTWDADETWNFLDQGLPALRDAGFDVAIPPEFEGAGPRRIRARIKLSSPRDKYGRVNLGNLLKFRWEITLGDRVLTGDEFTRLTKLKKPIVRWDGEWVLLAPSELEKLPSGLGDVGEMPVAQALRAALVGEHEGIPVVADAHLAQVLRALKDPPPAPRPMGLKGELRPYQARGYAWLSTLGQLGLGSLLADDMGLGKTVQLIAHILRRRQIKPGIPSLVVCPTSVLGNWERELKRFAPRLTVMRYHGLSRDVRAIGMADVVLTTYGLMVRDRELLQDQKFDVFALDEAQGIKNPDSQRARSARMIRANHRVALSGTPIENRLDELWSLMEFLIPGLLGPRATFRRTVAVPVERFGDEEVARQLRMGVSPFLLRRLKTDPAIIDDLPDKLERIDYTPLTTEQAALYEQVVDEAMSSIAASSDIERRGRACWPCSRR